MILGADCTVGVTESVGRQVFALNAQLGGKADRAVEVAGSICVRIDTAGRVTGIYVTGAVPEGARLGPTAGH